MIKHKMKIALPVLALAIIALFYFFIFDRTVATVGDYKISAKQVMLKNQLNKVYYPEQKKDYGKDQLIQSYTHAQILKNNGHEITDQILEEEEKRIDQNTKAPEMLQKIKDVFRGDRENYRKVFVLPTYTERVIYFEHFMKSATAQQKSLRRVRNLIADLLSVGGSLELAAKENRLLYRKFHLSPDRGLEFLEEKKDRSKVRQTLVDQSKTVAPENVQKAVNEHLEGQSSENVRFWINNVITQLKPGELITEPVDYGDHWLIVRYLKPLGGKKFLLEGLFVQKDSYEKWLEAEKAKVKISS